MTASCTSCPSAAASITSLPRRSNGARPAPLPAPAGSPGHDQREHRRALRPRRGGLRALLGAGPGRQRPGAAGPAARLHRVAVRWTAGHRGRGYRIGRARARRTPSVAAASITGVDPSLGMLAMAAQRAAAAGVPADDPRLRWLEGAAADLPVEARLGGPGHQLLRAAARARPSGGVARGISGAATRRQPGRADMAGRGRGVPAVGRIR